MAMNISTEGVAITSRFFEAIDMLVARGVIRGVQTFTRTYGINRRNLLHIRECPTNAVLKPQYIAILAKDYGVSADWLLTGRGQPFVN